MHQRLGQIPCIGKPRREQAFTYRVRMRFTRCETSVEAYSRIESTLFSNHRTVQKTSCRARQRGVSFADCRKFFRRLLFAWFKCKPRRIPASQVRERVGVSDEWHLLVIRASDRGMQRSARLCADHSRNRGNATVPTRWSGATCRTTSASTKLTFRAAGTFSQLRSHVLTTFLCP